VSSLDHANFRRSISRSMMVCSLRSPLPVRKLLVLRVLSQLLRRTPLRIISRCCAHPKYDEALGKLLTPAA
jgi:hypothetical protein